MLRRRGPFSNGQVHCLGGDEEEPSSGRLVVVDGASEPTLCARALDTAVSIAESLRDTGRHVLLIVDSLHDWAAALVAQEDALLLRTQLLCWAAAAHARLGRHCPAASAADNGDVAAAVARALSRSPRTRNAADGNMPSVEAKIVALFARASLRWVQPPALAGTSTSHVHGSLTLLATLAPQDWADGVVVRDAVVRRSLGAARTFWALDAKLRALRHHPSVNWKRSFSNEPPAMLRDNGSAVGARGSDCDYGGRCELVKELLLQEESLWQRAGGDPLAHRPRVTEHESVALATAQMLREDWLQQNIFDPVDFMCPLYKANAMLRNILLFRTLANNAIADATCSLSEVLSALRTFDPRDGRASYDLRAALCQQKWTGGEPPVGQNWTHDDTRAETERMPQGRANAAFWRLNSRGSRHYGGVGTFAGHKGNVVAQEVSRALARVPLGYQLLEQQHTGIQALGPDLRGA